MKKVILFLILLSVALSAFNQSNRYSYEFHEDVDIRNYNSYALIIINDSNYILRLDCLLFDLVHFNYISYGSYINSRNKIICKDKINGFELELIKHKDSCYVKRGPSFIKNKYLKYLRESFSYSTDIEENFKKIDSVYGLKKNYIPKTDSTFMDTLVLGEYRCDWLTHLHILPNNQYELEINTATVLKGKWNQENNKIIFYDESLNQSFVAEIVEKAIINLNIPIDSSNLKYTLTKKWE